MYTVVKRYHSIKTMNKGIAKQEKEGWSVKSTETIDQGYGCFKTGCLGVIFLPLALLGKKPKIYQVTFERE